MDLEREIKEVIVNCLGLDIDPEEINSKYPIFGVDENGNGLDLDSIDALELVVGLNAHFGIKQQSDDLSALKSVETIKNYIAEKVGV